MTDMDLSFDPKNRPVEALPDWTSTEITRNTKQQTKVSSSGISVRARTGKVKMVRWLKDVTLDVRRTIYTQLFNDMKVQVHLLCFDNEHQYRPTDMGPDGRLLPSRRPSTTTMSILLTCHAVFKEAFALFLQETRFSSAEDCSCWKTWLAKGLRGKLRLPPVHNFEFGPVNYSHHTSWLHLFAGDKHVQGFDIIRTSLVAKRPRLRHLILSGYLCTPQWCSAGSEKRLSTTIASALGVAQEVHFQLPGRSCPRDSPAGLCHISTRKTRGSADKVVKVKGMLKEDLDSVLHQLARLEVLGEVKAFVVTKTWPRVAEPIVVAKSEIQTWGGSKVR